MQKLVSKNPVLRFKEGKKILKALWGKDLSDKRSTDYNGPIDLTGRELALYKLERDGYIKNGKYTNPILQRIIQLPVVATKPKVIKPHFLSKYKDLMTKRGITSDLIIEWQNKLKDYYDPNAKYKLADGIWGHDTEVAYNNYMNRNGVLVPTQLEILDLNTIQQLAKLAKPTLVTLNILNLTPELTNFTPLQIRNGNYNKSQVRELMRQNGLNPYSFSGSDRKAIRLWLNGETDDWGRLAFKNSRLYDAFVRPYGYKQGGQLVSRNPILRFKTLKKK